MPSLLGRTAVPALMAHTTHVRAKGLGAELAQHQTRAGGHWVAAATVLTVALAGGRPGLAAAAIVATISLLMRRAFVRRLGGVTGDCLGAMVEIVDTSVLVAIAAS